jgi:16S rRNA (uracil1498-N3)-methyltransferase
MGVHRLYLDSIPNAGDLLTVEGDEAKHAVRVKRLEPGDPVQLLDGAGGVAEGIVEARDPAAKKGEWRLPIRVESVRRVEPVRPAIHVFSATPKGPRFEEMIDALSQAGAASWGPLATERGVVDPRETKLARIQRVAVEASKQCGRPWVLGTEPGERLAGALAWKGGPVILADATGGAFTPTGAGGIRLLVGPEGGWTRGELAAARDAGATVCAFGPHAMRIETAAVVATGIIMALERGSRG